MESEIEALRRQLSRARREKDAAWSGFFFGAMGFGYLAQWYLDAHQIRPTSTMIPLIGFAFAGSGLLVAMLFVAVGRLRDFIDWKRREADRLDERFGEDGNDRSAP